MIKLFWHEPSNLLAIADIKRGRLPLITVIDEEYTGINPFYSYPVNWLIAYGWVDLGEL